MTDNDPGCDKCEELLQGYLDRDLAPPEDRDQGFAMQVLFIGAGAVLASVLPWIFVNWIGVGASGPVGQIPPSVRDSFAVGAFGLLLTVMWTVATTRERPVQRTELRRQQCLDRHPVKLTNSDNNTANFAEYIQIDWSGDIQHPLKISSTGRALCACTDGEGSEERK